MTTYTPRLYGAVGHTAGSQAVNRPYVVSRVIDFTVRSLASGDVAKMLAVPAHTVIMLAGYETLSTVSGTGTLALSDGTNTWVSAATAPAAGAYATQAISAPKIIAAAADLSLTCGTATINTGQVRVFAIMCDLADPLTAVSGSTTITYTYTDRNNWA